MWNDLSPFCYSSVTAGVDDAGFDPYCMKFLCVSVFLQHYLCNFPKFWIPFSIWLGEFLFVVA